MLMYINLILILHRVVEGNPILIYVEDESPSLPGN